MIYFDVGANDGSSSIRWAREGDTVYAFEPNPEMIAAIQAKIGNNPHYVIIPCAVSDYEGEATFNVCKTHDRGCSSLLDVSEAGKTQWGGRTDMIPAEQITVKVITLKGFLETYGITDEIEFFHCDTQGSDLKVLKGLGEHIKKIKAGVVEAGTKPDILYQGQNTLQETMDYLKSYGFEIYAVTSNDVQNNEVNVYFKRA